MTTQPKPINPNKTDSELIDAMPEAVKDLVNYLYNHPEHRPLGCALTTISAASPHILAAYRKLEAERSHRRVERALLVQIIKERDDLKAKNVSQCDECGYKDQPK